MLDALSINVGLNATTDSVSRLEKVALAPNIGLELGVKCDNRESFTVQESRFDAEHWVGLVERC